MERELGRGSFLSHNHLHLSASTRPATSSCSDATIPLDGGFEGGVCPTSEGVGSGRSPSVYVQSYSTLNLYRDGLVGFYGGFDGKLASAVGLCGKMWFHYRCDKGHDVYKPRLCRLRRFCPTDAEAYVNSRVEHAYQNFKMLGDVLGVNLYLVHLVFTLPKELWDRVFNDPNLFFKVVYETLEYPFGGMNGGVASLHLVHSQDPLGGAYPHIHVILPNVVLKKLKQKGFDRRKRVAEGYFVRVRPFFNERLLKAKYGRILREVFGVEVDDVDVYVQYVKLSNEAKAKHVLRYAFRLPIQDLAPYLNEGLSGEVKEFVWSVLNYGYERIRWFGFLAKGVVKRYLGRWYLSMDVFMRFKEMVCPICYSRMWFVEYSDRPPPDLYKPIPYYNYMHQDNRREKNN